MLSYVRTQAETRRVKAEALTPELIRDFVIASHMDLEKVKRMYEEHPALLNAAHPWKESDHETAVQAAAQMGNVAVAEYLLSKGAPLEICTAAMLGRTEDVKRLLSRDPKDIGATGAHGIPLLRVEMVDEKRNGFSLSARGLASASDRRDLHRFGIYLYRFYQLRAVTLEDVSCN